MTREEFDEFCKSLPHTTHVVQWGDASVWKIAGKVFAIGGWSKRDDFFAVTFKVSDWGYEIMKEQAGLRPAPYLASRGMKWIQRCGDETLNDDELRRYIRASFDLITQKLSKKKQRQLGFLAD